MFNQMIRCVDFETCCRFCLKDGRNEMVDCVSNTELNILIEALFGFTIKETDNWSKKLCEECYLKLENMSAFRATVTMNQREINDILKFRSRLMAVCQMYEEPEDDDARKINDNIDEPFRPVPMQAEETPNNFNNDQTLVVPGSEESTISK